MKNDKVIISFIGPDGSGKSTLAHHLEDYLQNKGYPLAYFWWLEGENTLIRHIIRIFKPLQKFKGRELNIENNNNSKSNISLLNKFYFTIVIYEYLRFWYMKIFYLHTIRKKKIILLDRFIYDILLFLTREFHYSDFETIKILKKYSRLFPSPHLIFIIDVSPQIAFNRKPKDFVSLDDAREVYTRYQKLYSLLPELTHGKIITVDNSSNLERIKSGIILDTEAFLRKSNE